MKGKQLRQLCFVAILTTIMMANTPVHAEPEPVRMLVLIDASTSMLTERTSGAIRFAAAKDLAKRRIRDQARDNNVNTKVAIFTFHGDLKLTPHTDGFIAVNAALDAVDGLDPTVDIAPYTPLAGALCEAIRTLESLPDEDPEFPTTKILQLSSDGGENATPADHRCHGPTDDREQPPFTEGTWQANVFNELTGTTIVRVDLFTFSQVRSASYPANPRDLTPHARSLASTCSPSAGETPLEQFFLALTESTDGELTVIHDDKPLPAPGDLTCDGCVDHVDAIKVAQAFGPVESPADSRYDLDRNGTVDYADFEQQLSRSTSTCGPSPFTSSEPIVCTGNTEVVIEGQLIGDGGVTIDARGTCDIVITDSLIVSGQNAINITGDAVVTVDNSIIVGQDAVLMQRGSSLLSAGSTAFHGMTGFQGAALFLDRGGNAFH